MFRYLSKGTSRIARDDAMRKGLGVGEVGFARGLIAGFGSVGEEMSVRLFRCEVVDGVCRAWLWGFGEFYGFMGCLRGVYGSSFMPGSSDLF